MSPQKNKVGKPGHHAGEPIGSKAIKNKSIDRPSSHSEAAKHCPSGYTYDDVTTTCETSFGRPGKPTKIQSIQPNKQGQCPVEYNKHPYLALCFPGHVNLPIELGISGPHYPLATEDDHCPGDWTAHPYLGGLCINSKIHFDLDLGEGSAHPDQWGNCPSGWRKHKSSLNLCLDTKLDIDLGNSRNGRKIANSDRCTAGWNLHPSVSGLCVDSSLELSKFVDDQPTNGRGHCDNESSVVHPVVSNLCISVKLASTIRHVSVFKKCGLSVDNNIYDTLQNVNNSCITAAAKLQ